MERVLITAPAKINLYLDVTGKRSDGYHELVNIMQSISLSDTISIEKSNLEKISIKCNVEDVPKSRKNTASRHCGISCAAGIKQLFYFGRACRGGNFLENVHSHSG